MPFRLADVKKTVRARADGRRYVHPKLLGAESVGQVDLALAYFHARVGRARREIEPELLVRFFGDAKVARGIVACLGSTYRWRTQEFAEVLDAPAVAWLAARGIRTPGDLRMHLYDRVNSLASGFLAAEREERLRPLARSLHLSPAKLDQLAALDADEHAVLVRVGPVPAPEELLAHYNFQAIDALVRHSATIELQKVDAPGCRALQEACRSFGIVLTEERGTVLLRNQPDAFGSYARQGQRLARALYSAVAAAPGLLRAGEARLGSAEKGPIYLIDKATRQALTGSTGAMLRAAPLPELREDWDRLRLPGARSPRAGVAAEPGRAPARGTGGWRLITNPEPVLSGAGSLLAPYACRRDEVEVLLWPVDTLLGLAAVPPICRANPAVLPILGSGLTGALPGGIPFARAEDGAAGVVELLTEHWGGPRVSAAEQALESLLDAAETRGFVEEDQVLAALGSSSADEAARTLRALDPLRGAYVPGLGLCSPAFAEKMRKGLRQRSKRVPAA